MTPLNKEMNQNKRRALYDLQNMLYTVSISENGRPSVIPDGIMGDKTRSAIRRFQRTVGLPATGTADKATWDLLSEKYSAVINKNSHALCPDFYYIRNDGKPSEAYYSAQMIFNEISDEFENFSHCDVCGIMNEQTKKNTERFQEVCAIDKSGKLDKETWNMLVEYHNLYK